MIRNNIIFSYITLLYFLLLFCPINSQFVNCVQSNNLKGCITCSSGNHLSLNMTSGKMTCTLMTNCNTVDNQGDNCTVCKTGYALNFDTNLTVTTCIQNNGCKTMTDSMCTQCISSVYYLTATTGQCKPIFIDYCWKISLDTCSECSESTLGTSSNCSISSSLCSSFNYITWSCQICPSLTILHSSGVYCYVQDQNCLIYSINKCRLCRERYFYNQTSNLCQSGISINFEAEYISANHNYLASNSDQKIRFCINNNQYFNQSSNTCIQTTSSIPNCLNSNGSTCIKCLQKFFVYNGICKACSIYDNCKKCDKYNCLLCQLQSYLVIIDKQYKIDAVYTGLTVSITKCLPCSIYGCLYCRNQFNINGIDSIYCDQCLFGYRLFNYTCYSCPSGTYYSIILKQCLNCSVNNCQYCNTNPATCDQCIGNYYYQNQLCSSTIDSLNSSYSLNIAGIYQILNKSLPFGSRFINNNQKLLITSCQSGSNGYTCFCNPTTLIKYSSLCYNINQNILAINLASIITSLSNSTISSYVKQIKTLKLLTQVPSFDYIYQPLSNQYLSAKQFANYLQILTNLVRNGHQSTKIVNFKNWIFNTQYKAFNPENSTIFSGPGFYFKYSPKNVVSDDKSFVTISEKVNDNIVLVLFNSSTDTIKRITGNIYVFINAVSTLPISISIKKVNFLQNKEIYTVINKNGINQNLPISSNSDGYLIISQYSVSTASSPQYIFVSSILQSNSGDMYADQRIQNIIYQQAFIYILIVIGLYLFFIPLCAVTDCVDNKSSKRVVNPSGQQKQSFEGIQKSQQSEREQVVLRINYRDFFPIYNIANTPRPKRFIKLCLFIVNCQHSVTICTLIYFNLSAGQPIVAILLAIPAYLCTIILGYLCGILVVKLPNYTKYLINLVTLGYWAIWIVTMSRFASNQYKPFIYIFALIFFFIDMTIDFLQTLLMYFTIKQQEKQIKLFKALSKFLSYRGYYQFDAMARQINDIRNTE